MKGKQHSQVGVGKVASSDLPTVHRCRSVLVQDQAEQDVEQDHAAAGDQGEEHGQHAHEGGRETEMASDAEADAAEHFVAVGTATNAGLVGQDEDDGQDDDRADGKSHDSFP